MYHYLREPFSAAVIAAAVTALYIYMRARMNNKEIPNHEFIKPAALVGILVYFIIHLGNSESEPILKTTDI
jgi:uncharacterized membrane protein YphA (DoxX/SURF4 family)